MALLTRDGRVPKDKWVVMGYSGGRILSRHRFKSSAMTKALVTSQMTGKKMVVCEIAIDRDGRGVLWMDWSTGPGGRETY